MAKRKHKKQVNSLEQAIEERGPLPNPTTAAALDEMDERSNKPLPLSLADIRNESMRQHSNVAHTIADLEAWRAEIDATIAFLKRDR